MNQKIGILPTSERTPIVLSTSKYGGLFKSEYYSPMLEMGDRYQHVYILSTDHVSKGETFFDTQYGLCKAAFNFIPTLNGTKFKITASTEKELNLSYPTQENFEQCISDYNKKNIHS